MKLEKYTKQDGAFKRPMFREVSTDLLESKGTRSINVNSIIVSVILDSGETNLFQGDEESQNRLVRSGWVMEKKGLVSIKWKTADNKIVDITINDITNILLLSGQKQTELWF